MTHISGLEKNIFSDKLIVSVCIFNLTRCGGRAYVGVRVRFEWLMFVRERRVPREFVPVRGGGASFESRVKTSSAKTGLKRTAVYNQGKLTHVYAHGGEAESRRLKNPREMKFPTFHEGTKEKRKKSAGMSVRASVYAESQMCLDA